MPFPTPALPLELLDVLPRLAVDLVALAAVLALLTRRRRGGRDVVVACASFDVGLFSVAQVISSADLGVGAGFGLFAVLSIVHLRSELFSTPHLAHVFSVLALALVTGIPGVPVSAGALLATLVVLTLALTDGGRAARAATCATVTEYCIGTAMAVPSLPAAPWRPLLGRWFVPASAAARAAAA